LLLNAVTGASAAEYEVDGQIEQTIYSPAGAASVQKSQFTVFVKDCSWLIQTTGLDKSGKPVSIRQTACTNGAEVWEVAGPVNGGSTAAGHRPLSQNVATIVSNNVPVGQNEGYYVSHLWLMFASGCYFENLTNNLLTPVYDSNASVSVHPELKRDAKWDLVNGPGSLPSQVVYLDHRRDGHDQDQVSTNAIYMATGVTNAGTIKIPSGFVFEFRTGRGFDPGPILPGKTRPAYGIRKRAVATVTAVRPYCSRNDLSPTATGKTIVIDERQTNYLAQPTNLPAYTVKNGVQWVPAEEAKKLETKQPPKKPDPANARMVIYVLLVLPSVLFLFFLIKNRRS
jgi:hypothetical protein